MGPLNSQVAATVERRGSGGVEQRLKAQGHRIVSVYEANGFGFTLHRRLEALGVESYVTTAQIPDSRLFGLKTDEPDAHELCLRLDRYVQGNLRSLTMVQVPTPEHEQQRSVGRQRQQLVHQRVILKITGRSLLAAQVYLPPALGGIPGAGINSNLNYPAGCKVAWKHCGPCSACFSTRSIN